MIRASLFAAAAALALALPAAAQTVAITNARILTAGPQGEIARGTVVISGGKIASVGSGAAPSGAEVIDAGGKLVTPGLIASDTNFGGAEVDAVDETNDLATTSAQLSAAFDVQYGLDPNTFVAPVARLGGVTSAVVTPGYEGGGDNNKRELLFAGQAAVVTLADGTDMVVRPRVGMVLDLGEGGAERAGGARGAAFVALKAALDDVRFYMRNRTGFDRGDSRQLGLSRADLEALIPVVEGRMPLIVTVHRAADIRQVLRLAREEKLKVILDGAEEGWMVASEIAAAGVPVTLNPITDRPETFETRAATMENAARLNAAGVVFAIEGNGGGHRARETRYNAGNAVAHGLPQDAALRAVTINPARMFGVGDRKGSLEPGKDADLVIWDGDPFEPLTQPVAVFIEGRRQPMTARNLQLRDRYRTLNQPLPPAYSK
ncbi:MAG TPA: amidohydrolase family protein [Caulobacteraceae bacterium]